jgi:hypothetical protein
MFPLARDGRVRQRPAAFPRPPDQWSGPVPLQWRNGREGGPMASDITLAVGARRPPHDLCRAGESLPSARRLVLRHRWPRQTGNDGVVRVTVPLTALKSQDVVARTDSLTAPLKSPETADLLETTTLGRVTTTDPMTPDFGVACDRHYDIRTCGTTDTTTAQPVTMTDAMTIIGITLCRRPSTCCARISRS